MTREEISENISHPGPHCFDRAQRLIYGLMENDCYPRFLKSEVYQALLEQQWKHTGGGKKPTNNKKKLVRRLCEWLILLLSCLSLTTEEVLFAVASGETELQVWVLTAKHDPNNVLSCIWTLSFLLTAASRCTKSISTQQYAFLLELIYRGLFYV